ncbi:LRP16 family protein [Kwoniella mangroviensis CBS 8886]|nr:LRP16 family protein [Kwoniella mangroviensis CBS 8886]
MTTSPKDIPTLSEWYASNETPQTEDEPKYNHDEGLNRRVSIWRGDITKLQADLIVNAANSSLLGGGGVDGAIHRAAGPELLEECEGLGGAETGETKVTKGYELPSKYVAHTVGPIYSSRAVDKCAQQLKSCYQTSLDLCQSHGGGVIGFSSISTGVYGYPIKDATEIAIETTRKFLEKDQSVTRVIYVVFSKKDEEVYKSILPQFFPPPPSSESSNDNKHE